MIEVPRLGVRFFFSLGLALVMLCPVVDARVFLSGSGAPLAEVAEEIGLKQVYRTEYKINGTDAVLEVYAGELPAAIAASRLESGLRGRQFNVSIPVSDNGSGMGVLTTKEEFTRMMVVSAKANQTLIYAVRQSWEAVAQFNAAARSGQQADYAVPNVPSYPGARSTYHMEDQKSKTILAVYQASSTPAVVRDYYAQAMPSSGWQFVANQMSGMYRRGNVSCFVSVQNAEASGEVVITLLVRRSSL